MSVIETPPKDRMAIQTIVAKFDEKLIRTAVEVELERQGQVYFVHNRVETIYELAAKIRELVPQARVAVGHGQLPEAELERTMLAFMDGEFDVLCATSIIENGLDIPRANTIIINRADRHGLAELYQLRGRVGRSNRRAYAYLLIPPEQQLTEVARRRLAALKEFSDLGAGFKIAALDLELRGAGNMLGGEQSGHIEAIGFEMYTTMLEEAVSRLKGEGRDERPQVTVNLGISLRIDDSYIAEEGQRLRMYKRIAGSESMPALAEVRAELQDRYGEPPETVLHLLSAAEIRLLCEQLGIAQIERKRTVIEDAKKSANPATAPGAPRPAPGTWAGAPQRPSGSQPYVRQWEAGTAPQPLAGRHGQAPQTANLQFVASTVANRPETNATRAAREIAAHRPANTPLAQAGKIKNMRDMLYVTFSEKLHAAPAEAGKGINIGALMKLVARNAKQGAQLTPQGILKWPLSSAQADVVLRETRELLAQLDTSTNT
jgi:transcription-repair coupling factor (superfamily II helicase)